MKSTYSLELYAWQSNIYSVSVETIFNILTPLAQFLDTPRQLLSAWEWSQMPPSGLCASQPDERDETFPSTSHLEGGNSQ